MEYVLIPALLGLIPAFIAQNKGKSFVSWWIYGALLWIVALPHALIMNPDRHGIEQQQMSEGMKKCPYCAELVKAEAIKCRFCGMDFREERRFCESCGIKLSWEDNFCPSCGQKRDS